MPYSIATNFDPELIQIISNIDKDKTIKSVFGKLRSDILGGGRPVEGIKPINLKGLTKYIELCHSKKLGFNYLLNPMCLSNIELNPHLHKKIFIFFQKLVDTGIDAVTVNSPYLCETIKKRFPQIKVTIGIYALINDLNQLKFWNELGADELTLINSAYRNFPLLEEMLKYTRNSGMSLRLMANSICMHSCPHHVAHGTSVAHASRRKLLSRQLNIDYCIMKCTMEKVKNPAQLIASEWIRPEDIHYYEKLCEKTGNYNFSIKLLERTKNTVFLERVIKAYTTREYNGNLMDLVIWPQKKEHAVKTNKALMIARAITGGYNAKELRNFFEIYNAPVINIDNKKLDGFLEKFSTKYNCDNHACQLTDNDHEHENDAGKCNYCRMWAEKVVSYDVDGRSKWLSDSQIRMKKLVDGTLFR
jgi:collagenase-like PrtC family protease